MNIEEIKFGLELWDNRFPLEPPSDKHAEILYDVVRQKAKMFKNDAVENVRYLLSIIERHEKVLEESRNKAQILASHCAYCEDAGRSLDVHTIFEKSQAIYEILDKAVQGER